MRTSLALLAVGSVAALMFAGCAKEEPETPEVVAEPETEIDVSGEADRVRDAAEDRVEELEEAAADMEAEIEGMEEDVETMAAEAGESAYDKAVDEINQLIDAEKYQAAVARIKEAMKLPGLTEDQENGLLAFMDIVQQAMAEKGVEDTGEAAGDMLKGFGQ